MTHDDIVFLNDDDDPRIPRDSESSAASPSGSSSSEIPAAEIIRDAHLATGATPTAMLVDSGPSPHSPPQQSLPRSRFGFWFIAWPVVLMLAGFIFAGPYLFPAEAVLMDHSTEISQLEIQGKYLVGLSKTAGPMSNSKDQILQSLQGMAEGSWASRLCYAVLVGELDSPESAVEKLDELQTDAEEAGYTPTETQEELRDTLSSLYSDYERQEWTAPSIDENQRELLQDQLGWYGELALTPEQGPEDVRRTELVSGARTVMFVIAIAVVGVLVAGSGGFVSSIFFVVLTFLGKVRSALTPKTVNGNIYIETFALWFVLFFLISLAVQLLNLELPLIAQSAISALSLLALIWPLIRGVSFHDLRHEIGLYAKNPAIEVMWGFVCYITTIPLMAIGLITMLVMMTIRASFVEVKPFEGLEGPSHPIGDWLVDANWLSLLQIFILAAVMAPIIEETMFRGVLYRHLRDMTAWTRIAVSVLLSTLVNSLIFAAIHPQGIFGIPLLMSLAIGFSLAREWRGSLVAPMTMHAINNGGVTLLAGFMLSGVI